ncbi:class I SAM-dependent methyltransferase [Candidatus Gottesmanbacteria bacterium]|nr:class I SAM-dependent methyltransferase [Candidatus Gottesmanbacteria bacterium]
MTIIRTKIYDGDFYWFQKYSNYIQHGNVLKVGYGLGYASYFIQLFNGACTSVDIVLHPGSVRTKDVRIYDGKLLPFQDHSFDAVLCIMTLHHIDNWEHIFREMLRVTRKNIIIVEETHNTIWQKLFLVYNCWLMNALAGQGVDIHWNSYLSVQKIDAIRRKYRLPIRRHFRVKTSMFFTELFVLQKNAPL